MNDMNIRELKTKASNLPDSPGVYTMKNNNNQIIYIGKAKSLKKRVASYFTAVNKHTNKVTKMVSQINNFEYIITDSEFEALILECSLIKQHMPKYNILLKDSKGYTYIKITKEKWPKILCTKQKIDDKSTYFGPYLNSLSVRTTVEEILKIFKLPTCSKNFDKLNSRPCLNYYISKCAAPCTGNINHEKYISLIKEAILFLKTGSRETLKYLEIQMKKASESLNFEQAAEIRDKIKAIKDIKNKQKVASYKIKEQDVIAFANDEKKVSAQVFRFSDGNLYETENFILDFEDDITKIRTEFLERYYTLRSSIPKNIVLDGKIENIGLISQWLASKSGKSVKISIPKKGEQLKLIKMCQNNAYEALLKSSSYKNKIQTTLEELKSLLFLENTPNYIEAYDVSNLQGSDNVGGMVVFKNGYPFKSAYKKFKIKTVFGQDDYGSMKEMITRRIQNYDGSGEGFGRFPDLILIDGGTTHTKAIQNVLKTMKIGIPVFGMVKDTRHKTRAITTNGQEIEIKSGSKIFSLITKIQEEVHRFTIGYHKKLRDKKVKTTQLTKIPGIGKKRAQALLKTFRSMDKIANATPEELDLCPGITQHCAKLIYNYFNLS